LTTMPFVWISCAVALREHDAGESFDLDTYHNHQNESQTMSPLLTGNRDSSGVHFPGGCPSISYEGSATALCQGIEADGWKCIPRTLSSTGELHRGPEINPNILCDFFIGCSCTKEDIEGDYTEETCSSLANEATVDHAAFSKPIQEEICPAYIEACNEMCNEKPSCVFSNGDVALTVECSTEFCLGDFPTYSFDKQAYTGRTSGRSYKTGFMRPYDQPNLGCWGRLHFDGKLGHHVLKTIEHYSSMAKCCGRTVEEGGPMEYRWMSGNELVTSYKPWKYLSGTKVCPGKEGWHQAPASTPEDCAKL